MGHLKKTLVPLMVLVAKIAILSTVFVAAAAAAAGDTSQALPDCNEWCGNLQVPYPFGMEKGCYLNETFSIACNKNKDKPPEAFLMGTNVTVTNISISGELHVLQPVVRNCYPQQVGSSIIRELNLSVPDVFNISNTKNKFIAVGCNTIGLIGGVLNGGEYLSGCISVCSHSSSIQSGTCSGSGCCQVEIPKGLRNLTLLVSSVLNHTYVQNFDSCGYAFVTEEEEFEFSPTYIHSFKDEKVKVVLDWAVASSTCLTSQDKTNCICGPNSERVSFLEDGGSESEYRCQCLKGFEGNPYLPRGCEDIRECDDENLHDCKYECLNTIGNYTCNCPKNYKGDGRRGGEGCTRSSRSYIQIIIVIGVGFTVLLIGSTWIYLGYSKWKYIKQKERFFNKNGGFLLQRHLSQWQSSSTDTVRIFTQEELDKATNKYDDSAVVGLGGYGTVYRGVLDDGLVIAIKKSKLVDQSQTDQFINEVIVLSQINHRNVVKLLGCCLETQVPLLVYEFISNGTLFDHIHKRNSISLSWEARLKIASETAGVLSYLHSSASTPIIHRDIKSTNILLDENYTAKVSDFGASKLVPQDQTELTTMVQGTLGYLDPEYLLTSELTEKSDVYSFGIVLLELLTGKKAVRFDGPEAERNLAMYVLSAMKEDRLEEVVDKKMVREANMKQIKEVGKLAKMCLRITGDERPSMREVAMELEGLKRMQAEYSWFNKNLSNLEDITYLLDGASESSQVAGIDSTNVLGDSMKAQNLSQIPHGR